MQIAKINFFDLRFTLLLFTNREASVKREASVNSASLRQFQRKSQKTISLDKVKFAQQVEWFGYSINSGGSRPLISKEAFKKLISKSKTRVVCDASAFNEKAILVQFTVRGSLAIAYAS